MKRRTVVVNDKMQRGYRYELVAPPGRSRSVHVRHAPRARGGVRPLHRALVALGYVRLTCESRTRRSEP
jgi:hypothetical protein